MVLSLVCAFFASTVAFAKYAKKSPANLILAYDKSCWSPQSRLIAQISAVPVTCDAVGTKACKGFEKVLKLAGKDKYQVNFNDLAKRTGLKTDNMILAVTVCDDKNKNDRCEEKPIAQILRLHGKYFDHLYPEGFVNLDFHPVKGDPKTCQSL